MLYGLLVTIYVLSIILLIGLVLIQQGKGGFGIGAIGGGTQMLFGGSGGQSLFQKTTWTLGALIIVLSITLAIMKSSQLQSKYLVPTGPAPIVQEDPQEENIPQAPVPEKK